MAKSNWRDAILETEAILAEIAAKLPKHPGEESFELISLHRETYAHLVHAVSSNSREKIASASKEESDMLKRLVASAPESPNGMLIWLTYIAAVAHSRGAEPLFSGSQLSEFLAVVKSGMERIFWRL